ncbi:MAG: hypothetical protein ACRCYX_03580 [Dermatophilaceae bacterium]
MTPASWVPPVTPSRSHQARMTPASWVPQVTRSRSGASSGDNP